MIILKGPCLNDINLKLFDFETQDLKTIFTFNKKKEGTNCKYNIPYKDQLELFFLKIDELEYKSFY